MISLMTTGAEAACDVTVTIPTDNNKLANDNFLRLLIMNSDECAGETDKNEAASRFSSLLIFEQDTFRDVGLESK
jgi:hypothetical protein